MIFNTNANSTNKLASFTQNLPPKSVASLEERIGYLISTSNSRLLARTGLAEAAELPLTRPQRALSLWGRAKGRSADKPSARRAKEGRSVQVLGRLC